MYIQTAYMRVYTFCISQELWHIAHLHIYMNIAHIFYSVVLIVNIFYTDNENQVY